MATPKKVSGSVGSKERKKTVNKPRKKATVANTGKRKTQKETAEKKLRPSKKDTLINGEPVKLPRSVTLAKLNPFRLPVSMDVFASYTARLAGVFFVFIGAFFSYMQMGHILAMQQFGPQTATTGMTIQEICLDEANPDFSHYCDDLGVPKSEYNDTQGTSGTSVDATPDVTFTTASPEPFVGRVELTFTVENAQEFVVYAFERETEDDILLGVADKIAENKWKFIWDTSQYNDGEYKLRAVVHNEYGEYDQPDNKFYVVNNYGGTSADINTGNTSPNPTIDLLPREPLIGSSEIVVGILGAESVYITFINEDTDTRYTSKKATKISDTKWRLISDTTQYPDGEYTVEAKITNEYGGYIRETHTSIENNKEVVVNDTSESDESATQENTEDTITVLPFLAKVKGTARVELQAPYADKVQVELVHRDTKKRYELGRAIQNSSSVWQLSINSSQYPDGPYKITLIVSDTYGTYERYLFTTFDNIPDAVETTPIGEDETEIENTLKPEVSLVVPAQQPLTGTVQIGIKTQNAQFVELYAVQKQSLTEKFLGLATAIDTSYWSFRWNTGNLPNGDYKLFARIKNSYGLYESQEKVLKIYNEKIVQAQKQSDVINDETKAIVQEETKRQEERKLQTIGETLLRDDAQASASSSSTSKPVTTVSENVIAEKTTTILASYQKSIDSELNILRSALRSGNENEIARARGRLSALKEKIIESSLSENDAKELTEDLDARIRDIFTRLEEDTVKTEEIIKNRVGDEITRDSDNDGITDYDEVKIYATNPLSADTDGDGFIDGAEILSGFDPNDDRPEVLVEYESPKERGVTRPDLLTIEQVTPTVVTEEDAKTHGVEEEAVISGKALPNSYVTVYIFSTPVVVTVKTDNDGSWTYRFQKELEDGEHEVYVGVTDNTGRIVAKSEPYRFVKTAQAFTPVDAETEAAVPLATERTSHSLVSEGLLLIILSFSVIGIGALLILIGFRLSRPRTSLITEVVSAPSAGI